MCGVSLSGSCARSCINSLVHADYSQRGAPTRVAFFDDRIEIENPGILLPGMTVEDMRQGVSKIRNHVIARVFRELNLIEQWGSGIPRILREAEKLGLPDLQMEEIGMRVRVTVRLAEKISIQSPFPKATGQVGTKSVPSRHQVEILKKCFDDSRLLTLMAVVGRSDRTKFRNQVLQPLIDRGLIEMTIPDKPRSSKQRYRITALGKNFLKRVEKEEGISQ